MLGGTGPSHVGGVVVMGAGVQVVVMGVMLMGKLRGLPAHTDVVSGFRFGRVVRARRARTVELWETRLEIVMEAPGGSRAFECALFSARVVRRCWW